MQHFKQFIEPHVWSWCTASVAIIVPIVAQFKSKRRKMPHARRRCWTFHLQPNQSWIIERSNPKQPFCSKYFEWMWAGRRDWHSNDVCQETDIDASVSICPVLILSKYRGMTHTVEWRVGKDKDEISSCKLTVVPLPQLFKSMESNSINRAEYFRLSLPLMFKWCCYNVKKIDAYTLNSC